MAAFSNTVANHVVYKSGHQASILVCSVHSAQGLMSTLNETSPIGRIVGYSLVWGFGFGWHANLDDHHTGLPPDELSTVTAVPSSAPNLAGVLGVGILGAPDQQCVSTQSI